MREIYFYNEELTTESNVFWNVKLSIRKRKRLNTIQCEEERKFNRKECKIKTQQQNAYNLPIKLNKKFLITVCKV